MGVVFVGYTFLYTNNVVRPATRSIAASIRTEPRIHRQPTPAVRGSAQPSFRFSTSGFWAQGINVGLSFRF